MTLRRVIGDWRCAIKKIANRHLKIVALPALVLFCAFCLLPSTLKVRGWDAFVFDPALIQFTVPMATGANTVAPVSGTYTFSQTTQCQSASGVYTCTTPSMSVGSGDLVHLFCFSYGHSTSNSFSTSPSVSLTSILNQSYGSAGPQGTSEYFVSAGAQSMTFTCSTPNSPVSLIVLDYAYSGTGVTLDTDIGSTQNATTALSSGTFSTTVPDLVVFCAGDTNSLTYTAGTIGSATGTLRGFSSGSASSAGNAVCEDASLSSAQGSIKATMTSSGNVGSDTEIVAAFR